MANNSYRKEYYIERCRTQVEAFRLLQLGLTTLYSSLPIKEGGTFNKKNLDTLNKQYEGKLHFSFRDEWDTRYVCISIYDAKYRTVTHETVIGWKGVFVGGKVNGLKDLCVEINRQINDANDYVARYEKAVEESRIRLFQARYAAFYKAYKELMSMDMPEISIDYISDICPI